MISRRCRTNAEFAPLAIAFAIAALTPGAANAEREGAARASEQTEAVDSRIRIIPYSENSIITLRGHMGYQMLIQFDPAERIENVAIGDSLAWQVTPNHAATMLFLKPLVAGAATNLTVVTSLRLYSFDLRALETTRPSDPNMMFVVRFSYPDTHATEQAPPLASPPRPINLNYALSGSDHFGGVRVFDDGAMTYFAFPEHGETPAIFVVGEHGEEALVNTQTRAPYVVVDQVAQRFVLRSGRHRLEVRNQAFASGQGARP